MEADYTDVFPETAQTPLPEIPEEEGSEAGEAAPEAGTNPAPCDKQINRRFTLRPKRATDIEGNIKKVLHNVIKTKGPLRRQHLETIFEEPIKENGKVVFISVKRAKRAITFTQYVSKAKQKKRKAKAKNVLDRIAEARINEVQRQLWKMDL